MKSIQYTLRNIPPEVDRTLRARARKSGRSFNAVVVDSLARAVAAKKDDPFDRFYQASAKLTKQDHHALDEALLWHDSLPNKLFDE